MPPSTPRDAFAFQRGIDDAVVRSAVREVFGAVNHLLLSPVEFSARYFCDAADWGRDLVALLEAFHEELRPGVVRFADIFRYQDLVLTSLLIQSSAQELAECIPLGDAGQSRIAAISCCECSRTLPSPSI
jgi:hypothetical protein